MEQTDNTTNLDALLETVFGEAAQCEMPLHGSGSLVHGGDGNWYMALRCPQCTASYSVVICDMFRNFVLDNPDFEGACGYCRASLKLRDTISSMVRRG